MARVVVLGGGYAGLACLIALAKSARDLELHLIDAGREHSKLTHLHKIFREAPQSFNVPYAELAERFGFTFHQQRLPFTAEQLAGWHKRRSLPLDGTELAFDALVIATGASSSHLNSSQGEFGQSALRNGQIRKAFFRLMEEPPEEPLQISLVGGGATGIQVLFELHEQLRKKRLANHLRLIDLAPRLLPELPERAHRYIVRKLRREGIAYRPQSRFLSHEDGEIRFTDATTGSQESAPCHLTLLFPGVAAAPFRLETNAYGQVKSAGVEFPKIFSAGDCSHFDSAGLNALTAQAAVRKGKQVARNILRTLAERPLQSYNYREKGYLVSLGATDAIGWLGLRCNLISGFKANILKEAMESQYDLFLDGVDTFFEFP